MDPNDTKIPSDRVSVDDAGQVTFEIAGHVVSREDFIAFQLLKIEMNLRALAFGAGSVHTVERYTPPEEAH
jgi:hypothetical protein